jgi:hypothetical protein
MTDEDGLRLEAAEQFGFTPTDPDAERYECTTAQLIAFAKACERKGRSEAIELLNKCRVTFAASRILKERNAATDAELKPILEAVRRRVLNLCDDEGCPHAGTDHVCITTGPYRAEKSRFNDSWNIERQYPCINGLSAWFQVAVVHEADESEIGYTDGAFGSAEERATFLVNALNGVAHV